ncbi:hypothetical protein [Thermoplasma volcanium]|nr:hypothetical protein [Thermoplasma volcanium]
MKRSGKGDVERKVLEYVSLRPEVYLTFRDGLLNLNALAKMISEKYTNLNPLSVRASLQKLLQQAGFKDYRKYTDDLLRKSKIVLQDKVTVITSRHKVDVDYLSATFLTDSVVYIIDESRTKTVPKDVQVQRDVSLIHIFSPPEIVSTPGFALNVVERVYSMGINIIQLISCSNETMIVLKREDSIPAYKSLTDFF